jgi:hypothetical protein
VLLCITTAVQQKLSGPSLTALLQPTQQKYGSIKPEMKFEECFCDKIPSEGCGFLVPLDKLVNKPEPIAGLQEPPCILNDTWIMPIRQPIFSVLLTVWNQEEGIAAALHGILNFTTEAYELIVVFDGCRDKSVEVASALLDQSNLIVAGTLSNLVHLLLIKQPTPVWETSANNIGMRAAAKSSQFLVLVQDDQHMDTHGWNTLLALRMRLREDALAVTGRCAHSSYSDKPQKLAEYVGRCGANVGQALVASNETRCTFPVRDTANRGPLL